MRMYGVVSWVTIIAAIHPGRHAERQTERQTDRQTDRQRERQAEAVVCTEAEILVTCSICLLSWGRKEDLHRNKHTPADLLNKIITEFYFPKSFIMCLFTGGQRCSTNDLITTQ